MMQLFSILALVAGFSLQEAQPRFIEGLDDIPILADLALADEPLIFDKPLGTVARFTVTGAKNPDFYYDQYRQSLAAFGWQCKENTKKITLSCTRLEGAKSLSLRAEALSGGGAKLVVKLNPEGTR